MGKSEKKIKSDRINTLRKQYDAFLEDDKKRKDRNEYILGRLEEMRSSSALVKIHHKGNSHANDYYYSSRGMPNYLSNSSRIEENLRPFKNKSNVQTDCMTQRFEPSILREISKKYILIPKLQTCISSDENCLNPLAENADTDWKSKYNILNELKKSEKETILDNINVIFEEQHKPVPIQESINTQQNKENDNVTRSDNLQDFNMHTPIYDTQSNKSNSNINKNDLLDAIPDIKPHNNGKDDIRQVESSNQDLFRSSECNKNDQYSISVKNIYKTEVPQEQFTEHKPEISINMEVYSDTKNNTSQDLKKFDANKEDNQSKEKSDQENFDNDSTMEQITTEEYFEQDIKNSIMQQNMTDEYFEQDVKENNIANTNKIGHEVINDEDIHESEGLQKGFESFKETEPELRHIQNYESNEAPIISDQVVNEEINELENEQNQMFYTENSEKPYEYEENNMNMVEYSAENENFTTDQYPYHDESQQEQPYTTEINEHEESTERYDPNYEQQYADNNYENVVDVPQYDNQQYEVDNSYEIQQAPLESNVNYEEVHPNNENFEHMQSENISYQNQEENDYNFQNENYESEQYVTNEQEYSTTDPNIQEQYAEQEYIQMHTEPETIQDMEKGLDSEDGYIDNQNTTLIVNTENTIIPEVSPDETESSLKAT